MNTRAPGFNADDDPWDAWGDEPADDAREVDDTERAISSLRWGCDEQDWLACAAQANALGVEEI